MIHDFYHCHIFVNDLSLISTFSFQFFFPINIVVNILKLISIVVIPMFTLNVPQWSSSFCSYPFLKNNIFETFETPFTLFERFPQTDFSKHQFSQYHYTNSRSTTMLTDLIPENLSHFAYSYSRPLWRYICFSHVNVVEIQQYNRHMSLIFFVYSYLSKLP